MATQHPKTASPNPSPGRKSTTRPSTEGTILPVTNPLDLWYLCQKAGYAEKYPLKNSNGSPMYQRTVTQWVRKDGEFFGWHFPGGHPKCPTYGHPNCSTLATVI
uniref:Uncharacterized protein n=1 Tax=Variovorax paradoxus (strain S110) TaxID=543728 RepID=C5CNC8_VARPS